MLSLDDSLWQKMDGGYKGPYNASRALKRLFAGDDAKAVFEELWDELHHQGDLGQSAYAAVPHLLEYARQSPKLDWNVFALISCIEHERPHNPEPQPEIADAYFHAVRSVPTVVGTHPDHDWDDILTASIVSCIAYARGQRVMAWVYAEMHLDEARKWLIELGEGEALEYAEQQMQSEL